MTTREPSPSEPRLASTDLEAQAHDEVERRIHHLGRREYYSNDNDVEWTRKINRDEERQ